MPDIKKRKLEKDLEEIHKIVVEVLSKIPRSHRSKLVEFKSDPPVFQVHWENRKNFDLRDTRDRVMRGEGVNVGDVVLEREFNRNTRMYSGREIVYRVLSIVKAPLYNIPDGNIIMSFHPIGIKTEGNLKPRFD